MMATDSHSYHSASLAGIFLPASFFVVEKSGILLMSQKTYQRKGKFI